MAKATKCTLTTDTAPMSPVMSKATTSSYFQLALFCLFTCVLSSGCAQKDSSSSDSSSSSESSDGISIGDTGAGGDAGDSDAVTNRSGFRVTTFNAGLLPTFVPLADERVATIAQQLDADSSDVLCLQETWRERDQEIVDDRLAAKYPFRMRASAQQKLASSSPACTVSSFEPMAECLLSACALQAEDYTQCAITNCGSTLFELAQREPECAAAVFAQAGRSSSEIAQIQQELLSETTRAGLFAFDGASGTTLYSRLPLEDQEVVDFFDISTSSRRVALLATVRVNNQSYRLACTHLASNLDGVLPYTGQFSSWGAENAAQADRLLQAVAANAGETSILLGDFNCSEANGETGAGADIPASCAAIRGAGYSDPAANAFRCTYCNDNALNQLKTGQGDQNDLVLDHIFIRGARQPSRIELIFTQEFDFQGNTTPLSDHYGLSAEF